MYARDADGTATRKEAERRVEHMQEQVQDLDKLRSMRSATDSWRHDRT